MSNTRVQMEIGALADLDIPALKDQWRRYYGAMAPKHMSRELMVQAIAYRIQEEAFGGLSVLSRTKLGRSDTPMRAGPARVDRTVKSGTLFIREWQGRTIEVIADEKGGFQYRGSTYKSLSAVARAVTGTRWSGPAFLGLKVGKARGSR